MKLILIDIPNFEPEINFEIEKISWKYVIQIALY